jgi:outer membrane lipoprotein-sorting protein
VYFEWPDGTTGERLRGSIILRHDGVYHPDVIARAPDVMPTVPGAPSTVDGETAESVLEKMERATADARSLKAEVVMRGAYLGQTVNETGELLWMSPGMFRLKTALFLVNCDGRRTLLVMPQLNTGMELSGLGELELSPGIGSSAKQLKSKYEIRLVSKGTAGGRQAFELVMRQPLQGLAGVIGSGRVRLWVDAQTWLPLRGEMDSLAVDYRNMQLNPPGITDASFAYSPPAGMNILSFGSLLGSLGSTGLPSSTPGDGP